MERNKKKKLTALLMGTVMAGMMMSSAAMAEDGPAANSIELGSIEHGDVITVSAGLSSAENVTGIAAASLYDDDGRLISIRTADANADVSFTFDKTDNAKSVKVMWWDSLGDMHPNAQPKTADIPGAEEGVYVLMNIPYGEFYAAELGADDAQVDAVSSATLNKPRTGTLAGGSYHVNADGSDISGVIYPVFVKDASSLENYVQINDESSVDITVTNRGTETTTTYSGKDALFESADYSYYILSEKPKYYKTLNVDDEGKISFSAVSGKASVVEGASGSVTVGGRHTDIEIKLADTTGIAQGDTVSAAIITTESGAKYGLRHVANIWRAVEIGWNLDEMNIDGKITNVRYYTQDAVYDYPVEIEIPAQAE